VAGFKETKHFTLFILLMKWYISGTWEPAVYDLSKNSGGFSCVMLPLF
jgi:hypothetical protein